MSAFDLTTKLLWAARCLRVGMPPGQPPRPLAVVSAAIPRLLVPCGCASNQSGGLPRRADLRVATPPAGRSDPREGGGGERGKLALQSTKFEAILRGGVLMDWPPTTSAPRGPLGPGQLRRLAQLRHAAVVNQRPRPRRPAVGRAAPDRNRCRPPGGAGGRLARRYATAELHVSPPRQAVLDALSGRTDRYDAAIVLAYLPEDQLRQLAEDLPEADAVVGGPTGQPISPQRAGSTLLWLRPPTKGSSWSGSMPRRPGAADRWTGSIIELTGSLPTIPGKRRTSAASARRSAARTSAGADFLRRAVAAGLAQGLCRRRDGRLPKCHEEDDQALAEVETRDGLEIAGGEGIPRRSRVPACHTTGYGLPGGFASLRDKSGPRTWSTSAVKAVMAPRRATSPSRPYTRPISPGRRTLHRLPRPREQPEVRLRQVLEGDRTWGDARRRSHERDRRRETRLATRARELTMNRRATIRMVLVAACGLALAIRGLAAEPDKGPPAGQQGRPPTGRRASTRATAARSGSENRC